MADLVQIPAPFGMRATCSKCGCREGTIEERGAQDVVRCAQCSTFQYNAPRTETGKKVRSVTTIHNGVKPKQRARVLMRANCRCEICGKRATETTDELHVGHIVSVKRAFEFGLNNDQINNDENMIATCAQCNLGMGSEVVPAWLVVAIIMTRLRLGGSGNK